MTDEQEYAHLHACPLEHRDFRPAPETVAQWRDEIKAAVRDGIVEGFSELKKQAAESTGRFVLGSLGTLVKRVMWISVFLFAAWYFAGASGLSAAWKTVGRP